MTDPDLRQQRAILDSSIFFILVIIASVLLSLLASLRQREALRLALAGEDAAAAEVGEVYPLRHGASALVLGALGFFLCLAAELTRDTATPQAARSAQANLWASILVLCAAIVRWRDLERTHLESLSQGVETSSGTLSRELGPLSDTLLES